MGAILALLARPLVQAALSAFGHLLLEAFQSWQANRDAKALGRAEATQDAATAAQAAQDRMEQVPMIDDDEALRRLREGSA